MSVYEHELKFTDRDFAFLHRIAYERTGISLGETKREMLYGRLARRVRQLGLSSFAEYCARIESDADGELGRLVNAITTNLTAFFREGHHFEHLAATALPDIVARDTGKRRLRIWSAGCSTGKEPYSIAMIVAESGLPAGWDARILATDIDTDVLAIAKSGVYRAERVHGVSPERLRRWFQRGSGENAGNVRVIPALRESVAFRHLNLLDPWPMHGPFDIIFCRNVVIYFDAETQRRLFARFADMLAPGGYLYIGHSESLFRISERFRPLGGTMYRKI